MRRVITTRGTTQITENFKFPVTYRTLTSPLPLRSNTEGVYSLSLSVLRLRGDKSLESLTIASHQPATLSRLHNPTVLVIVVFVIFKFCFELYYSVFDLSIVFLNFLIFIKIIFHNYIFSILMRFVFPDSPGVTPPVIIILSFLFKGNSLSAIFFAV